MSDKNLLALRLAPSIICGNVLQQCSERGHCWLFSRSLCFDGLGGGSL
jgi:hypothetical protein